jgi:hypothetical protein
MRSCKGEDVRPTAKKYPKLARSLTVSLGFRDVATGYSGLGGERAWFVGIRPPTTIEADILMEQNVPHIVNAGLKAKTSLALAAPLQLVDRFLSHG